MGYGSTGTIWAEMGLNYSGLVKGMQEAKTQVRSFDREINGTFSAISASVGHSLTEVGRALSVGVTVPLTAALGLTSKWAMEFEASMAKVWSITDISKRELKGFGDEIEALSLRVPQSASQLADGLYDAISSGIRDVENAVGVVEVAAKAAVAGVSDTATAVDAQTTVLNAYGLEADQVTRITDLMFKTVDRGKVTFGEMAGSLGQVVSTAATAGVAFDEIAAAYSTLTRGGINAAETSTALNQTILSIINPTSQAANYAKQLGIEFNASALASKGLSGVLEDVYRVTGGNIEKTAALFTNVRALKGVLALTRNDLKDFTGDLEQMANAAGATESAYAKQMSTMKAKTQLFRNELALMGRTFGTDVMDVLNSGIQALKPLVQAFAKLPDGVRRTIVEFGAFAVSIGPVSLALGVLAKVLAGPTGIVLAAGAAAAAVVGVVRSFKDAEEQTRRYVGSIESSIKSLRAQADEYGNQAIELEKLIDRYESLKTQAGDSKKAQEELLEVVRRIGTIAPDAITEWDDLGRAIDINAEKAQGAAVKMLEARKMLLEVALRRAELERPNWERTIERDRSRVEKAGKDIKDASAAYEKARDRERQVQNLATKYQAAKTKEDIEAVAEAAKKAGIMAADVPARFVAEAIATSLIDAQREANAASKALEKVTLRHETLLDSYYDAEDSIARTTANMSELAMIIEKIEGGDLKAGLGDKTASILDKSVTPTGGGPDVADELTTFEEWSRKIEGLSDAYKTLKTEWDGILENVKHDDIAVRTWANQRADAIISTITNALKDNSGDWFKAASEASLLVKRGYAELEEAGKTGLAKALDELRHDSIVQGWNTAKQLAEMESINISYKHTGTLDEQRQFAEQLVELRRRANSEVVASARDEYEWQARYWEYTAAEHVAHLNRMLTDEKIKASMSVDDEIKLQRELLAWTKRSLDEQAEYRRQSEDAWNQYYVESGRKTKVDLLELEVERRREELELAEKNGKNVSLAQTALRSAELAVIKQRRQDARDLHEFLVRMGNKDTKQQLGWIEEALKAEHMTIDEERDLLLEQRELKKQLHLEEVQDIIERHNINSKNAEELLEIQSALGAKYDEIAGLGIEWEDATEAVARALETVSGNLDAALDRQSQIDLNAIREGYDKGRESAEDYMEYLKKIQLAHDAYSSEWLALEREKERVQADIYKASAETAVKQMGAFADMSDQQLFDGRKALTTMAEAYHGLGNEAGAAVGVLKDALTELISVERNRYDTLVHFDKLTFNERAEMLTAWLSLAKKGSDEEKRLVMELADVKSEIQREIAQTQVDSWVGIAPGDVDSLREARNVIGSYYRQAEAFATLLGPEYRAAAEVYKATLDELNVTIEKQLTEDERRAREARARQEETLRNQFVGDPAKYLAEYKGFLAEIIKELENSGDKWSDEWARYTSVLAQVIAEENRLAAESALNSFKPLIELEYSQLDARYEHLKTLRASYKSLGDDGAEAVRLIDEAMTELTRTEKALFDDMVKRGELDTEARIAQVDRWIKRETKGTTEYSALLTQRFELDKQLREEKARSEIADMDIGQAKLAQLQQWQSKIVELRKQELTPVGADALKVFDNMLQRIAKELPGAMREARTETAKATLEAIPTIGITEDLDGLRESLRTMEAEYIGYGESGKDALKLIREAIREVDEAENVRYQNSVARGEIELEQQIADIEARMRAEAEANGKLTNLYEQLATEKHRLEADLLAENRQKNRETAKASIADYGDFGSMTVAQLREVYDGLAEMWAKAIADGAEAALAADEYAAAMNRVSEQVMRASETETKAAMTRAREQYRVGDVDAAEYKRLLVMRREGLAEYSDEWISLGIEIENVTSEIYKRMADNTVKVMGDLSKLTGDERTKAIATLKDELNVYSDLEQGAAAVKVLEDALKALAKSEEDAAKVLALLLQPVDSLEAGLHSLANKAKEYADVNGTLAGVWFSQEATKLVADTIKQRIGAVDRMNEHDVDKAEETLAAIRMIVADRLGVESAAMDSIIRMAAELATRRIDIEHETADRQRAIMRGVEEEMAKLRGDDETLLIMSLERQIQSLRDAGWAEIDVLRWVVAHSDKVRKEQVQAEYQFRKRIGTVSLSEQIKREQQLAKETQKNMQQRTQGASDYYDALIAVVKDADALQLKSLHEVLAAHAAGWAEMGEDAELYLEAVKAVMAQAEQEMDEKDFGKRLVDRILGSLGEAGNLIRVGMEASALTGGNPMMVLAAVFTELALKSRAFGRAVEALDPLIETLVDTVGELIAPLVPIIHILVNVLTPILKAVAAVFGWVADVVVGIWNGLAKAINFLLGWLGVRLPVIENTWRDDHGITEDKEKSGTQISEITGPTRDLLVQLLRPLTVLDTMAVYAESMEKAIYSMRDAFLSYAGAEMAVTAGTASVMNEYHIATINIYTSSGDDFDSLMTSLGRRAEMALLGSGA